MIKSPEVHPCPTCNLFFYRMDEEDKRTHCPNCERFAVAKELKTPVKQIVCDCGGTKVGMPHFRWCSLEEKAKADAKKSIEGGWDVKYTC
jgi:hypothetical protein